jgi:hypothetical protein
MNVMNLIEFDEFNCWQRGSRAGNSFVHDGHSMPRDMFTM